MKMWISAAFAAGLMIAATGAAQASPLGSASRDIAVPADNDLIQVQGGKRKGNNAAQGAPQGGGNRAAAGAGPGNRPAAGGGGGGGNRVGRGGGGNGARTAAGIAVGIGLVGGLIAADQQRRAAEQEYYVDERPRCPYGSYINRYGEYRCRR